MRPFARLFVRAAGALVFCVPPISLAAEPAAAALHASLARLAADPVALPAAIERGRKAAGVCRHCHGPGGNSVLAEVPNLASQNADYLLEQMHKFVHDQRRSSDFMAGLIRALTPEERVDIALFLSRQPVAYQTAAAPPNAAGRAVYRALCIKCHGEAAAGSQRIPRLAGQQLKYLQDSLTRYRSGQGERIDPSMAANTKNLKDADIRNLAAYLSALRP